MVEHDNIFLTDLEFRQSLVKTIHLSCTHQSGAAQDWALETSEGLFTNVWWLILDVSWDLS